MRVTAEEKFGKQSQDCTDKSVQEDSQKTASYYVDIPPKPHCEEEYIFEGEALEDLQYKGLKILQQKAGYRFTSDAVLLANNVSSQRGKKMVELCSGSGVISLLVAVKQTPEQIVAVELQPDLAQMSARSVALCGLGDKIRIICGDVLGIERTLGRHLFDTVICNPPYRKVNSGEQQKKDAIALCRHEVALTLEQVIATASVLLKDKGELYLVHQTQRLAEIVLLCASHQMEVKQIIPIYSRHGADAKTAIVRVVRRAKSGLTLSCPIYIYDEEGNYTASVKSLYDIK